MPESRPASPRPTLTLLTAGLALSACAGLAMVGYHAARLRGENSLLRQRLQLNDLQMRSQQTRLATEQIITQAQLRSATTLPDLQVRLLHPNSEKADGASACVIWTPARRAGLLFAENLPPLANGQEYRLWISSSGRDEPRPCGAFQREDATAESPFQFRAPPEFPADIPSARFSVSIENAGPAKPRRFMLLSTN